MPVEANAQQPQAGNAQPNNQPQAGDPTQNTPANPQAGEANTNEPTPRTPQEYEAEIARLRREAADKRVKLNEYEEKARKEAEAQMTEAQKAQARAADMERQLAEKTRLHQEKTVSYEVKLHAAKLGIVDPDAASKLMDWSQLDYDDDGNPKNIQRLLTDLVKSKPYLAGPQSAGNTMNPATNNGGTSGTFTLSQIEKMSPQEYDKNRTAIWQAKREGRILNG